MHDGLLFACYAHKMLIMFLIVVVKRNNIKEILSNGPVMMTCNLISWAFLFDERADVRRKIWRDCFAVCWHNFACCYDRIIARRRFDEWLSLLHVACSAPPT